MNSAVLFFIGLLYLLSHFPSLAQFDTLEILNDDLIRYFDSASENLEESDLQTIIEDLIRNRIDLNSADKSDLLYIPFISPKVADQILNYRNRMGGFKFLNELLRIKSVDQDLFVLLKSFIEIGSFMNKESKNKSTLSLRTRMISDLKIREGYKNGKYKGSKQKYYNRLKAGSGNISLGVLIEKDPGEISIADHFAGYINYRSSTFIENILVGDYNVEFGQGLVFWRPYAFSKGTEAVIIPIKRSSNNKPFLSAEENLFFRGTILTMKFNDLKVTGYYSNKKMDANIEADQIINLNISGYHRTESELLSADKLKRESIGIKIVYQPSTDLKLGILHMFEKFSSPFINKSKDDLRGDQFRFTALSYDYYLGKLYLNGELGYNGRSFAHILNAFIGITDETDVLLSYRNYPPSFFNISSSGFGEFGKTKNETGFYFGIKSITEFGKFNIYFDLFRSPSPSYGANFPAVGHDFLINYSKKIKSRSTIIVKYKREEKESNSTANNNRSIVEITKTNYRCDLDYRLSAGVQSKTRIEYVEYNSNTEYESGLSTFQQFKVIVNNSFSILSRITIFDTRSYNSRIYQFENDLQGVITNKVIIDEGFRWYILVSLSLQKFLKLSLKYSDTFRPSLIEIGSGNSRIEGNVENQIGLQIDFRL